MVVIILFLISFINASINETVVECNCKGKSEILFLIDASGSITPSWPQLVDFLHNISSQMCISEEEMRIGVILSTHIGLPTEKFVYFNLTGDRMKVLEMFSPENMTQPINGRSTVFPMLIMADILLERDKRDKSKVFVIVLSDMIIEEYYFPSLFPDYWNESILNNCIDQYNDSHTECTQYPASTILSYESDYECMFIPHGYCYPAYYAKTILEQKYDAKVFGVLVGASNFDCGRSYMKYNFSSHPDLYYMFSGAGGLFGILDELMDYTCSEIFTIIGSPCKGDDIKVTVKGTGFHDFDEDGWCQMEDILSVEATIVNTKTIECTFLWEDLKDNGLDSSGKKKIEVGFGSFPSITSTDSRKTITYGACTEPKTDIDIMYFLFPLMIILCILLILAISFLLFLSFCIVKRKPKVLKKVEMELEELPNEEPLPEEPKIEAEPEPEAYIPPPKIERTTYFVGGKAVGVDWGREGLCFDTPYRAGDMGMGKEFGYNKKTELYKELAKRKKEKRKNNPMIPSKSSRSQI